jgi:hypothetical protein
MEGPMIHPSQHHMGLAFPRTGSREREPRVRGWTERGDSRPVADCVPQSYGSQELLFTSATCGFTAFRPRSSRLGPVGARMTPSPAPHLCRARAFFATGSRQHNAPSEWLAASRRPDRTSPGHHAPRIATCPELCAVAVGCPPAQHRPRPAFMVLTSDVQQGCEVHSSPSSPNTSRGRR